MIARILAVDDEAGMLEVVQDTLSDLVGAEVQVESDPLDALERIRGEPWDLLLIDLKMPGMDGVELLRLGREACPDATVLMMTAFPTVETAVSCVKLGAVDYLTKPFIPADLLERVRRALEERRLREEHRLLARQVEGSGRFDELVGEAPAMLRLFEAIRQVAGTDADVLISGESGTGKELVARSIHRRSGRTGRFVPVDCGAIPENLFESELFGHERGAFTGATARTAGLLEFADRGTLFLDEVGELPLVLQAKLLRTLQERSFRRVGGREETKVNVRVVAASNRDLREAMAAGTFRGDLFYRLNVVPLQIPPLRERPEDIPRLFRHFLQRYGSRRRPPLIEADPDLVGILCRHSWPGNVRELQSAVRRMVALCREDRLTPEDLPEDISLSAGSTAVPADCGTDAPQAFFDLRARHMDVFEKDFLEETLRLHSGNVPAAAKEARLPRGTFYRLVKKHGISPQEFRERTSDDRGPGEPSTSGTS